MRKAVNILQTAGENISKESIYNAAGSVEPEYVKKMVTTALAGDFNKARTDLNKILMDYGISGDDIIKQIHESVFSMELSNEKKLPLLEKIGECEFRLIEGSNPRIQLESLLAQISMIGKK